jgi:hypothetical protein
MGCRLALEVTLSSGNELLIGIISLLVVLTLVAAGSDHDLLGLPLWPPVAAFGTPLCTLADCLEGRLPVALDKNSPDRLLARGMPSGDIEHLLRGPWLIAAELMHQGSAVRVRPECQDDIGITDLGELVALLRELLNVIP